MMSAQSIPNLTILDVGHANAAILADHDGIIIFDVGQGQRVRRFLKRKGVNLVKRLIISHADTDHCGGAISILKDNGISVVEFFQNPDATKKDSISFKQLRLALAEARRTRGTTIHSEVSTSLSGKLDCGDVRVEVVYPPPEIALAGVGGTDTEGNRLDSNALSAVIRLTYKNNPLVLLAADITQNCVAHWVTEQFDPAARILVYPHHGGFAGTSDIEGTVALAEQLSAQVRPDVAIFSIHRTRHNLPRQEVISTLIGRRPGIRLICTQVPERIRLIVCSENPDPWSFHRDETGKAPVCREGNVSVEFTTDGFKLDIHGTR